jgi:sec-independent protein translocase protein TatC
MTMFEHLDELRYRLIVSMAAFVVISIGAFIFYERIFDFLLRPLCSLPADLLGVQGCKLVQLSVLEGFQVRLKMTALVGLAVASPIWLYQLWAFIVPGLTQKEKKYSIPFISSAVTLFAIGATFAYLVMPTGIKLLLQIGGEPLEPLLRADSYINFVGLMLIAFGVTFELPLVLLFLGLVGVVTPALLRKHRRAAAVGIVALAAVVTPSQDPYTMLIMALPLYLLYEVTIVIIALVLRRRARAESL